MNNFVNDPIVTTPHDVMFEERGFVKIPKLLFKMESMSSPLPFRPRVLPDKRKTRVTYDWMERNYGVRSLIIPGF